MGPLTKGKVDGGNFFPGWGIREKQRESKEGRGIFREKEICVVEHVRKFRTETVLEQQLDGASCHLATFVLERVFWRT